MKAQRKSLKNNHGNIMLLCIVSIAVMVTLSNLIMALIIGRSQFTKKNASINDVMLSVEDANIQYQKEFLILQSENLELVEYYFINRFYTQVAPGGFSGSNSVYNRYLKSCITNNFQKQMNVFYVDSIKDLEKPGVDQDIPGAEDQIKQMADFLYAYLTANRMSQSGSVVPSSYSMDEKLTLRQKAIAKALISEGVFRETKRTADMNKELYLYKPGYTLEDYYEACWPPSGGVQAIGTYLLDTVLEINQQSGLGIRLIGQQIKYTFLPADFEASYNGFGYEVRELPGGTKMKTNKWVIKGE